MRVVSLLAPLLVCALVLGSVLAAGCGSSAPPRPELPPEPEIRTIFPPVVREVVPDDEGTPRTAHEEAAGEPPPETGEAGPPREWRPAEMAPAIREQIRSKLTKARAAAFRILRWMVFAHGDGRGTAYVVYELSRHDACQGLARASRSSRAPSGARARFEHECTAQTSVPMERCRYVGLARFSIHAMPAAGTSGSATRLDLTRDEVLDPELCSFTFKAFSLRDLDGEPDPEVLVEFEWRDLVSEPPAEPGPTKKVHSLVVFRPDLSVQESRILGAEYFEDGNTGEGAPTRGSYRFEDVNGDGHADLVIEKETTLHCRGCRSTRERLVLRYDPERDAWR